MSSKDKGSLESLSSAAQQDEALAGAVAASHAASFFVINKPIESDQCKGVLC